MNAIADLTKGSIVPVPNMRVPLQGAQAFPILLDHTANGTLDGDLSNGFYSGVFDYAQSVYIDNRNNASTFKLTFPGLGPNGFVVQAQPYTQGYYPVSMAMGDGRFSSNTTPGIKIAVVFYNVPMPYFTWGPVPGVLVTPALSNLNEVLAIGGAGNTQLVAGVGGKTIKLYRAIISVDANAVLKLTNGPGGALIAPPAPLVPYGSIALQVSGVPWGTCGDGDDLTMNLDAACNAYVGIGYVQD